MKIKINNLKNMINGWFIGFFDNSIYKTSAFEVSVKRYKPGDREPSHHHKMATEITTIISGSVKMNGKEYYQDDIIMLYPGISTDFECLTDVVTVVVKTPSILNDKFFD